MDKVLSSCFRYHFLNQVGILASWNKLLLFDRTIMVLQIGERVDSVYQLINE
jgi:hypothetical protein